MPIEFLTFDCYGTLVDWENGIADAVSAALVLHGIEADRTAVLAAHAEIEPAVQAESFRSYRDVLTEVAWRMGQRFGWPWAREACRFLPESLGEWKPFPDTNAALSRIVGAGVTLGILSNVDDDLIRATLRQLDVDFELLVTAQQVRAYKPATLHFEEARRQIGDATWWHAAQSLFHDVAPSRRLGIPVVWVNRQNESVGEAIPDVEVPDLLTLAAAVVDGDPPLTARR